jgi:putative nucleotidyltransferase with HDIG domain
MVINGVKANIKRAIFFFKGLNINDDSDYKKGIKIFKDEMLKNFDKYVQRNKEENRYVMLRVYFDKEYLTINIKNNSPIQQEELARVKQRIEKANSFNNMADLFVAGLDNTEGAGLGIGMVTLMLKNEGIGSNAFSINTDGKSTIVTFKIPIELRKEQVGYKVAQKMIDEVDELPAFDENVDRLQKLIRDPKSDIHTISQAVQMDISLTSSILKLANSAAFAMSSRIENVDKAVRVIGLRELNSILYSIGTRRVMENRYAAFEEIWETSSESAYYVSLIAKKMRFDKELTNNLTVAALLHDIGRVILLSLEEETVRSVMKISGLRNEPSDLILEEAVIGVSHTTIGSLIAKKWNFPDLIQKSIEYHHVPYMVKSDEDKKIVYPIYLADRMVEYNQGVNNIEKIYSDSLEFFNFDKESFARFASSSKKQYIKFSYQS